jgi:hypothetical protein
LVRHWTPLQSWMIWGKQLSTGSGGDALKEVVSFELMRSASPLA